MRLYKYRSLKNVEYIKDIILYERLYCSKYDELNDPFEGLFFSIIYPRKIHPLFIGVASEIKTQKRVEQVILNNRRRICCLSSTLKDVRLWSYYADGHKGIAVEIEIPSSLPSLHAVTYVDHLPEFEEGLTFLTSLMNGPTSDDVLSFKTRHWEFEKEYRIIQEQEHFSIAGCISAIYTGIRTPEEDLAVLKKVTLKKIPIFETRMDAKNVEIEPMNQR